MRFHWAFEQIPQGPQDHTLWGEAADWCVIFILDSQLTFKIYNPFLETCWIYSVILITKQQN